MQVGGLGIKFPIPTAGGLGVGPTPVAPAGMPSELAQQMEEYRIWAEDNKSDAKRDAIRFWGLKIPAILTSASSSALAYFNARGIAVVAGAVAAACVLVDGLNPQGALRNVHKRAYNDIAKLVADMREEWRVASLAGDIRDPAKAQAAAAKILVGARAERDRIQDYITKAETSMGDKEAPRRLRRNPKRS
jgi:hypothetical protein